MDNNLPPTQHTHTITLPRISKTILFSFIFFLLGTILAAIVMTATAKPQATQKVTVIGKGYIEKKSDSATITGWLEVPINGNREQAKATTGKAFQEIKTVLKTHGFSESLLKTQDSYETFATTTSEKSMPVPTLYPVDLPLQPSIYPENPILTSYFTINVNSENLNSLNQLKEGIEKIQYIKMSMPYYYLKDQNAFKSEAKEAALIDARKQADNIAKINKSSISKLISIKEIPVQDRYMYDDSPIAYYDPEITYFSSLYEVVYELKPSLFPFGN